MTIRIWIDKGWLPPSTEGWTAAQVRRAARSGRQVAGRGSLAEHGTESRWRAGCACEDCTAAHNDAERRRRAAARAEQWREAQRGRAAHTGRGAGQNLTRRAGSCRIRPAGSRPDDAGVPGLEPRMSEPESLVLPITLYPKGYPRPFVPRHARAVNRRGMIPAPPDPPKSAGGPAQGARAHDPAHRPGTSSRPAITGMPCSPARPRAASADPGSLSRR